MKRLELNAGSKSDKDLPRRPDNPYYRKLRYARASNAEIRVSRCFFDLELLNENAQIRSLCKLSKALLVLMEH